MIDDRRYRLQQRLLKMSRPVSFEGNFVGVGFSNYEKAIEYLSVIPEDERRRRAKVCLDEHLKPMFGTYVLGANFIDAFLDTASGFGGR
jgi:hypothetical protein